MISKLKKIGISIAALIATLIGAVYYLLPKKSDKIDPEFDDVINDHKKTIEDDLEELKKKQEYVEKNGLEDKSLEEELEYWKNK